MPFHSSAASGSLRSALKKKDRADGDRHNIITSGLFLGLFVFEEQLVAFIDAALYQLIKTQRLPQHGGFAEILFSHSSSRTRISASVKLSVIVFFAATTVSWKRCSHMTSGATDVKDY